MSTTMVTSIQPVGFILTGLLLLFFTNIASSSTSSRSTFSTTKNKGNIEFINLIQQHDNNLDDCNYYNDKVFLQQWKRLFPKDHDLYTYDAAQDPTRALSVVNDAFCFAMTQQNTWMPPMLVKRLHSFAFDPNAPCALVISGLPIDNIIPPTPCQDSIFQSSRKTTCPVAETVLLGISRALGIPMASPTPITANLIRDIAPTMDEVQKNAKNNGAFMDLCMHRDMPRQMNPAEWEPELLLLFCVRSGDHDEQTAATTITDSRQLIEHMSKEDQILLRTHKVQTRLQTDEGGKKVDIGRPFFAIEGNDVVTLRSFPDALVECIVEDGGVDTKVKKQVEEAFARLSAKAEKLAQPVFLKPGELLILNNARCVHGRTAYKPKLDGTDRWLLKTYVSNGIWRKPGSADYVHAGIDGGCADEGHHSSAPTVVKTNFPVLRLK